MGNLGGIDAKKLREALLADIKAAKTDAAPQAEEAGEKVGQSFADGIEQGLEDAASRISASSVKITKAFNDLAKKITSQNISLGSINIDFSDIDINSEDFQKKLDEAFENIKIGSGIKFDSKETEKQFKDMLGLHIKYADKLYKLQEQKPKLTNPESIKANAKEQLAIIDGLKEIRKAMNDASDSSISLPHVLFGDAKALRTEIDLLDRIAKGEDIATKRAEAAQKTYAKKNKELERENEFLRERNRLLGGDGTVEDVDVEPKPKKPRAKKSSGPSEEDITRQRGEEMKAFVAQFEGLQKELGDTSKWFGKFNDFLNQIQQGALTAAEAVAKLREEMLQSASAPNGAKNAIPNYSMLPKEGKKILYHNTSSGNVDSILENGLRADAGKGQGRGKDGDLVWATTIPNQKGYGGNTIAFQIDVKLLADNPSWQANDTEYHIPVDIPAEDILFVDRPITDTHRESDIADLVRKFGVDKVKDVLGRKKNNDSVSNDRVNELVGAAEEATRISKEQEEAERQAAELARQRAEEGALNAEIEDAVVEAVEAEIKAEQEALNLAKEKLQVEQKIAKEKEKQYGYHAGKFRDDGFRPENLWQSTPSRGTGFYGTGTYMTDAEHIKEITTGRYGTRPLSVIDPDMYNLFAATDDKTADQLHQFLKGITKKAFGAKGANIKSLYAEFKELFPKDQVITYDGFKDLVNNLQAYVKENYDNYSKSKLMDSVSTKFMKGFGYEGVDTRGTRYADTTYGTVIYDLKEESIVLKEITDEIQKQEIVAGNIASVIDGRVKAKESGGLVDITVDELDKWLNGAKDGKDQNAGKHAETSTPKIESETNALDNVGDAAEKAAGKKKKFARANKEVAASVDPSVKALENEADAIEDVGEAASEAANISFSADDAKKLYNEMSAFAEERKEKNGFDKSKVSVKTNAANKPIGATISYYNKQANESIVETFQLAEDESDRLILKTKQITKGIADFDKANLKAIKSQSHLMASKNKVVSTMSTVLDPNSNKTLAGTDYEKDVAVKIQAIRDEIAKLDPSSAILSEEEFLAVESRIEQLTLEAKELITQSKNATYAPSQLESHSVDSKIQYNKDMLQSYINDWKRAGIYSDELQTKTEELSQSLGNIKEHKDFKKYLEGLKEARALAKLATQDKRSEEDRQKSLNAEYRDYMKLIKERNAIEKRMIGVDDDELLEQLRELYDKKDDEINSKYGGFLSREDVQNHFNLQDFTDAQDEAEFEMELARIKAAKKKGLEEEAAAQKQVNEAYEEYKRLMNERGSKQMELVGLDPTKNKDQIDVVTAQIDDIDEKLNTTYGDLLSNKVAQATLTLEDFLKYYEKWQQKIADKEAKASDKARNKEEAPYRNYGKTTANAAKRKQGDLNGAIESLGVTDQKTLAQIGQYNAKVKEVLDLREQFANDPKAAQDPKLVKQFQKASYEAEQLRRGIKGIVDEEQRMMQESAEQGFAPMKLSADQIANLKNEMASFAQAEAQGRIEIKGFNDDNTKMYYTVTNAKGSVEEMTVALGQGTNHLYKMRTATKETGTLMQQIFKGVKVKAKELISYVIGGGSVYKVISMLRQGVQYVREIDLALTELKKVTDETEETYDKFLQTAAKTGARLGSTISAVTEATATFAKLGYSMKQASEMAESAIVYKNVGDGIASTEDAADSIISTLKGFKMEASESMAIVDKFNEVGNRFAITSQGIGEALRLSASALNEGKNSLDESIGLITAANEVVNDPSSVGTALKTLTLRLRGSKTELEEMGEDVSDMATTTSQLQAKLLALTGGKVDIMLDANTFKNSTQILREMAKAWQDMSDIQRAHALELMGGKRQANVLSALIQNFDTVEKVIETSQKSAGSALKENERYLDSIQGKIDQFNNATQAMWSNFLDSDTVKNIVEFGTELIKIVDDVGLLTVALVGLGAYISTKYMNMDFAHPIKSFKQMFGKPAAEDINLVKNNLQQLESQYESAKNAFAADPTKSNKKRLDDIDTRLKEYKEINNETISFQDNLAKAQSDLAKAQSRLDNYTGNNANTIKKYQGGVKKAQANVDALKQSQQQTAQSGSAGWQQLGTKVDQFTQKVQSAVASMLVMYAISKIMSLIGDLWDKAHETAEEAKESFEELSSELSKTESELSSLESQLKDIKSQIEDINETTPLTFTDQEELSRLEAQSAELQRQIDLLNTIKEQQAIGVNAGAINAAHKYAQTGVKTGKTTGENVSSKALGGAGIGAGLGVATGVGTAILGTKAGAALGAWAGPVGMLIGAAVGALAGGAMGAAVGGIESAYEEKIGDSLDNMKSEYERLQSEYDTARAEYMADAGNKKKKKKFEEAQEAFNTYQSNMAGYMTEMDSYYSQIKQNWDQATTEQKQEYIEWQDTMDTWAIQTGGTNAKTNAIERVFGDEATGNIAKARDEIKKLKDDLTKAKKTGRGVDEALAALENYKLNLSDEEVQRLRDMGIYLYEVEDYFKDVVDAESEFVDSDLEDVAKDINKITDGLDSLKTAFDEVIEEGNLTAKSILSIKESLGIGVDDTKELTSAWREYLDVMMSGTATTEKMIEVTEKLAQEYIEDALIPDASGISALNPDTKHEYIAQLRSLGVDNAEEYVEDLLQKNMVQELSEKINVDREVVREKYYEKNGKSARTVEEFKKLSDERITQLAVEYGVIGEMSDEVKADIMERYGAEEDAIDAIIQKLLEKETLENKIANLQEKRKSYDSWRNGDDTNKGFLAIKEDLGLAKKNHPLYEDAKEIKNLLDMYQITVDKFYNKEISAEEAVKIKESLPFYDKATGDFKFNGQSFDNTTFLGDYVTEIIYAAEQDISSLQAEYDRLWKEGENKGYIVDGRIINPDFQQEIDSLRDEINGITDEIDDEITISIDLKLDLQNRSKLVDDIQNVFDTLADAVNEYNENGYLTVDTAQALTDADNIDPKYLTLLQDSNGQLTLTKDKLYEVAVARLTDLKIKRQDAIITEAENLAASGSIEKMRETTELMYGEADALQTVNEARIDSIETMLLEKQEAGELDHNFDVSGYIASIRQQVGAVGNIFDSAIDNIHNSMSAAGNTAVAEVEDAFKNLMDYYDNRIEANQAKYDQIQNDIDWLESQGKMADADYYRDQLDLLTEGEASKEQLLTDKLEAAKDRLEELKNTNKEGSEEWFRKKPAYLETYKRNPLNCWNFLRALYTTTQG